MAKYLITYGDDDPLELPDDLSQAQDFMMQTINEMNLPHWRKSALLQQTEHMPRAGFSFTDQSGTAMRIERVK